MNLLTLLKKPHERLSPKKIKWILPYMHIAPNGVTCNINLYVVN